MNEMKRIHAVLIFSSSLMIASIAQARPYAGLITPMASADSASVAGANPAGIIRFKEPSSQIELLALFSESTWEGQVGDNGPPFKSTDSGSLFVPSGYMVRPINEDFSFSFTVIGSGFSDDLGDWPGKYFIESYEQITLSALPSLAYRVNDKLSIAGSLAISYSSYDQERAVDNQFDPGYADGSSELETDGFDLGFGASMLYQITDKTRWGISYRSELDPTLDGDAKFSGLGPNTQEALELSGVYNAEVEVESISPQNIVAGIYHEFDDRHALTVDLVWADFSNFKLSEFYIDGDVLSENEAEYEDIYALSGTYSWPVSPRWMMSVGGMYVDDMVKDDKRTLTLRLDAMWSFGVATEWQWTDDRAVQFGINYMSIDEAPVTTPEVGNIGSVSGEYSSRDAVFFRVGMTFGAL